jgi:hypothetical protein
VLRGWRGGTEELSLETQKANDRPGYGAITGCLLWIPRGQAQEHRETEYRECAANAESKCQSLAQPERFAPAYCPLATTAEIPLSDKITVSAGS